MNAVDANVLVCFVDGDEPVKRAEAVEVLDRLVNEAVETVLLWQVAAKFLSCLRRWENQGRISRQEVVENPARYSFSMRLFHPALLAGIDRRFP